LAEALGFQQVNVALITAGIRIIDGIRKGVPPKLHLGSRKVPPPFTCGSI